MVLETDPVVYINWLPDALRIFLAMFCGIAVAALIVSYLIAAFRSGPLYGGDATFKGVQAGVLDLVQMSPRRIWALARLAIQESIRRRVWVTLVLFAVVLGFAGWFLDPDSFDPARLYLSFVLNWTAFLILIVAVFLSVFSLPADMKNRTIYTIVTKPVRCSEIVVGRILGFSLIGTVLLAMMAACSYVFVKRGVSHIHEVDVESLQAGSGSMADSRTGRSTSVQGHRHEVTLDAQGNGSTDIRNGHWHEIVRNEHAKSGYVFGQPEGFFMARVPLYGVLKFKDRWGKPGRGISVGKEWSYRSFIEGGTLATATWTFENVTRDQFPDGLPVEMTIRVFRSWKGKMDQGILGSLAVRNPKTGRMSNPETFRAKDAQIDHRDIPLTLRDAADPTGQPIDLFKDLVAPDGSVELVLQCLEPTQYFGVAKADLYLKAREGSFWVNFVKGHLGIWCQLMLVTGLGVMFSTFLSGPVAMLATLAGIVLGFFSQMISDLVSGVMVGGGPVESAIRVYTQTNQTLPLEEGITRTIVQQVDYVLLAIMQGMAYLLPDFHRFGNIDYVAYGFDVPYDTVLLQLTLTAGYLVAVAVVGTFILKSREVAK